MLAVRPVEAGAVGERLHRRVEARVVHLRAGAVVDLRACRPRRSRRSCGRVLYMIASAAGSAALRSGVKLPSMSMPPTLEFRSTNCSGRDLSGQERLQPVLHADVVGRRSDPCPFGASGVTVTPKIARMKSKLPQRSPVGFVRRPDLRGREPAERLRRRAGARSGRRRSSGSSARTGCPGSWGCCPRPGAATALVANSGFGRRRARSR